MACLLALVRDRRRRRKKGFLVLDELCVHHCKPVKARLAGRQRDTEVFHLSGHSPELKLDERFGADLDCAIRSKVPVRTKAKLYVAAAEHLQFVAANEERVLACFQAPIVKCAARRLHPPGSIGP